MTREQRDALVLSCRFLARKVAADLLHNSTRCRLAAAELGYTHEDLEQTALASLLLAAERWDPSRSQFSTFAVMVCRRAILHYLSPTLSRRILGGSGPLGGDEPANDPPERDDRLQLILDALGDRDRLVLDLHAGGLCASAIGCTLGLSKQRGNQLLHRAIARAKEVAGRLK